MSKKSIAQTASFTCLLTIQPSLVFSEGSIGLDYFSSDLSIQREAELQSAGPGISLGWSISDNWALDVSHSRYDGDTFVIVRPADPIRYDVDNETSTSGIGLSYLGDNHWISLSYSRTKDEQDIYSRTSSATTLELGEVLEASSITGEIGYEWIIGGWSPSLSAHITHADSDIEHSRPVGPEEEFVLQLRDEISGTDVGLSASTICYLEVSQSALLAPSAGLFYQRNVEGKSNGSIALRNGNRVIRTADGFRGALEDEEQISGSLGINLLTGDWIWSAGYIVDLASNDTGDSWFVGLNYLF